VKSRTKVNDLLNLTPLKSCFAFYDVLKLLFSHFSDLSIIGSLELSEKSQTVIFGIPQLFPKCKVLPIYPEFVSMPPEVRSFGSSQSFTFAV